MFVTIKASKIIFLVRFTFSSGFNSQIEIMMLFNNILLFFSAVTSRREFIIFFHRVAIIILLFSVVICYNSSGCLSIYDWKGIYSGLFHSIAVIYSLALYIYIVGATILLLSVFSTKLNSQPVEHLNVAFSNLKDYLKGVYHYHRNVWIGIDASQLTKLMLLIVLILLMSYNLLIFSEELLKEYQLTLAILSEFKPIKSFIDLHKKENKLLLTEWLTKRDSIYCVVKKGTEDFYVNWGYTFLSHLDLGEYEVHILRVWSHAPGGLVINFAGDIPDSHYFKINKPCLTWPDANWVVGNLDDKYDGRDIWDTFAVYSRGNEVIKLKKKNLLSEISLPDTPQMTIEAMPTNKLELVKLGKRIGGLTGVYRIINKVTNTSYIGSALNLGKKICNISLVNMKDLSPGSMEATKHYYSSSKTPVIEAITKYGQLNFKIEILTCCFPEDCAMLESHYIEKFNPSYNINKRPILELLPGVVSGEPLVNVVTVERPTNSYEESKDVSLLNKPIFYHLNGKNLELLKGLILDDNQNKAGIYRWINRSNSKSYIGSSTNLGDTFIYYYDLVKRGVLEGKNEKIEKALIKYGLSNFIFEVIKHNNLEELKKYEEYYVSKLNPGYNINKPNQSTKEGLINHNLQIVETNPELTPTVGEENRAFQQWLLYLSDR
jgi:hypothetical protein